MTVTDTELGFNNSSTNYGPFSYGSDAGTPTVDFALSESEHNKMPIRSIESIFNQRGWANKVNSGFARLHFHGKNAFSEEHEEAIVDFCRIVGATFVDFEVREEELQERPSRDIQNLADSFHVFVPEDWDFDEDVFQFYASQANSHGSVDFIFKVDSHSDEQYIQDVVREFKIYDSDVWLYPKGRKARTVSERMEAVNTLAKRHTWNVSPRIGIQTVASEEIIDEDE